MEPVVVIAFIFMTILLGLVMILEFKEYRKYVKAAHGVMALAKSMQTAFDDVSKHLNLLNNQSIAMGQGMIIQEQQISLIQAVLEVHSTALNLQGLKKSFDLQKDLIKISGGLDGEDGSRAVPG